MAEVNTQSPAVGSLAAEDGQCSLSARNVDEVSVGKAPWLARPAVDSHPDVDDVVDVPEDVVEVAIRQIERDVSDE